MIIKIMREKTCSVEYLVSKNRSPSDGPDPRHPTVLAGNVDTTPKTIAALNSADPRTSLVLSHGVLISLNLCEDWTCVVVVHDQVDRPVLAAAGRPKSDRHGRRRWVPDTTQPPRSGTHLVIANVHLGTL